MPKFTKCIDSLPKTFVYDNQLRCPDKSMLHEFEKEIEIVKKDGNSIGGIVEIVAHNVPAGLGEPVFDKLSVDLAKAIMSIPAVKGVEIGDGFLSAEKRGSENNDCWVIRDGKVATKTNHAGGIVGGISTGNDIVLKFALKPTPSISKNQLTIDKYGNKKNIEIQGRHDPCVCPRAVPVGEAMVALVLADHYLRSKTVRI